MELLAFFAKCMLLSPKRRALFIRIFIDVGIKYTNHPAQALYGSTASQVSVAEKQKPQTMREVQSESEAIHPFAYNFHFAAL